jgi:hypothetical protein
MLDAWCAWCLSCTTSSQPFDWQRAWNCVARRRDCDIRSSLSPSGAQWKTITQIHRILSRCRAQPREDKFTRTSLFTPSTAKRLRSTVVGFWFWDKGSLVDSIDGHTPGPATDDTAAAAMTKSRYKGDAPTTHKPSHSSKHAKLRNSKDWQQKTRILEGFDKING